MASRVGLGPYVPKIEKKTVLVTGGGGFLGRETVKHLQENDWVVRNLTRCPKQDTDIDLSSQSWLQNNEHSSYTKSKHTNGHYKK